MKKQWIPFPCKLCIVKHQLILLFTHDQHACPMEFFSCDIFTAQGSCIIGTMWPCFLGRMPGSPTWLVSWDVDPTALTHHRTRQNRGWWRKEAKRPSHQAVEMDSEKEVSRGRDAWTCLRARAAEAAWLRREVSAHHSSTLWGWLAPWGFYKTCQVSF